MRECKVCGYGVGQTEERWLFMRVYAFDIASARSRVGKPGRRVFVLLMLFGCVGCSEPADDARPKVEGGIPKNDKENHTEQYLHDPGKDQAKSAIDVIGLKATQEQLARFKDCEVILYKNMFWQESSGVVNVDGKLVRSAYHFESKVLLGTFDKKNWVVTFANQPLGFTYRETVVTNAGEAFKIDLETGQVLVELYDLVDVLRAYVAINISIAAGKIDEAKELMMDGVEVVDELPVEHSGVLRIAPLNVKVIKENVHEGNYKINNIRLTSSTAVDMGNPWAQYFFFKADGIWKLQKGFLRRGF